MPTSSIVNNYVHPGMGLTVPLTWKAFQGVSHTRAGDKGHA